MRCLISASAEASRTSSCKCGGKNRGEAAVTMVGAAGDGEDLGDARPESSAVNTDMLVLSQNEDELGRLPKVETFRFFAEEDVVNERAVLLRTALKRPL